jgi:hypothetical protein
VVVSGAPPADAVVAVGFAAATVVSEGAPVAAGAVVSVGGVV